MLESGWMYLIVLIVTLQFVDNSFLGKKKVHFVETLISI